MLIDSLVSVLKAIGKDIKTIADSVDKKADSADLSSKRDISNTDFNKLIAIRAGSYSNIRLYNDEGEYTAFEGVPQSNTQYMGSFIKRNSDNTATLNFVRIPNKTGVVALEDDMRNLQALLHKFPDNTSFTNLSNVQWNQKGLFSCFIAKNGKVEKQPTQYGQLINLPPSEYSNSPECAQLWIEQAGASVWTRGGNAAQAVKDRAFRRLAFIDEIRYVVAESTTGPGFWRVWSDGWLEQGGYVGSSWRDTQLNYNLPFRSEPSINVIARALDNTYLSGSQCNMQVSHMGNTGCRISMYDSKNLQGYYWQAWGWKA